MLDHTNPQPLETEANFVAQQARPSPEVKAHDHNLAGAYDALTRGFEEYKAENDERLRQIEQKGSADVLTEEKLARIDKALDHYQKQQSEWALKARRPHFGTVEAKAYDPQNAEHKAAFYAYMRSGDSDGLKLAEAKALSAKSMSAGSGPDGGFLVPHDAEREILSRMAALSPMRAISSVRQVSTASFKKAYATTGPAAGWVAETAARVQGTTPILADLTFPTAELYAMPAATQTLLDDAITDLESWIASEVEVALAEQESAAFVTGDGVDKPKGFLDVPSVNNNAWAWGSLGFVPTGVAGNFAATNGGDALVDLVYGLKAGYRQNATFTMNRKTQAALRKLKDGQGNYLWQPPTQLGGQAMLLNFPVTEMEAMPDMAAGSSSVAFGDFRRGYLIVDRMGIRTLRDPYSAKPYVLFYTTKRVGGGVQDFDAIKLLKFS